LTSENVLFKRVLKQNKEKTMFLVEGAPFCSRRLHDAEKHPRALLSKWKVGLLGL
jgi:hypothetical protein